MVLMTLAQSSFNIFDPSGSGSGGVSSVIFTIGSAAPLFMLLVMLVYVAMAWYVYCAASRMANLGHGPALFPPFLWGLASLAAPVIVPFGFAMLHYATWFEPEGDVPWSRGFSGVKSGFMRESTDLHLIRVAELQEELAAARGAHRRRYLRAELRRLEDDGAGSGSESRRGRSENPSAGESSED